MHAFIIQILIVHALIMSMYSYYPEYDSACFYHPDFIVHALITSIYSYYPKYDSACFSNSDYALV